MNSNYLCLILFDLIFLQCFIAYYVFYFICFYINLFFTKSLFINNIFELMLIMYFHALIIQSLDYIIIIKFSHVSFNKP